MEGSAMPRIFISRLAPKNCEKPLQRIEDMLLISPEGVTSVDVLAVIDGQIRGFQFLDLETLDDEGIAHAVESELAEVESGIIPTFLTETFSATALNAAISLTEHEGENIVANEEPRKRAEIEAISAFLSDHVDMEVLETLRSFRGRGWSDDAKLFELPQLADGSASGNLTERDILSFLNSPHALKRVRAMRKAPFFAGEIARPGSEIQELVDRGAPFGDFRPALARVTGLSEPARLKAYLSLQSEFVTRQAGRDFWPAFIEMIKVRTEVSHNGRTRLKGVKGTQQALPSPRRIFTDATRAYDSLPVALLKGGLEFLPAVDNLYHFATNATLYLGVDQGPVDRLLRKVDLEKIPETCIFLEEIQRRPAFSGIRDYHSFVSQAGSAIAMSRKLAKLDGFDLRAVHDAAEKVLGDHAVTDDEWRMLSLTVKSLSGVQSFHAFAHSRKVYNTHISEAASLKALGEMNTRWHHNTNRLQDVALTGSAKIEWSPLVGTIDDGPVVIRELTSSDALRAQGAKENHCVGSYTSAVLEGSRERFKLIFSIEKDRRILSTFEVNGAIREERGKLQIAFKRGQHFARENSAPCDMAQSAAERLMDHLCQLSPNVTARYMDRLESNAGDLKESLSQLLRRWDANILDPNLSDTLGEELKAVLPKRMRDLAFIDEIEQNVITLPEEALRSIFPADADPTPTP